MIISKNPLNAEVIVSLKGKEYTLCYDWEALNKVRAHFKDDSVLDRLHGVNPEGIAKILEFGLAKHHKEITAKEIIKLSPPLFKVIEAVGEAVTLSYFGEDVPEELKGENVPEVPIKESKKKTT
jgi:hypothetical protein